MSQDIRQWSARAIVFVLLCIHQPGCHAAGSGVLPATVLSSSPTQAGDAAGQCGSVSSLAYNDRVMVCIGFEAEDRNEPGGPGSKAVFYPRVDQYSSISVDQRMAAPLQVLISLSARMVFGAAPLPVISLTALLLPVFYLGPHSLSTTVRS